MKYLITIILILTLFTGCYNQVNRWPNDDSTYIFFTIHPTRPDICPQEHITRSIFGSTWFKPGDSVYTAPMKAHPQSKHQKCNDLYGGCSYYGTVGWYSPACIELSYPNGFSTEETCVAKGGKWEVSWCLLPYIE